MTVDGRVARLFGAFLAVAASFVLATVLAQSAMGRIDRAARTIYEQIAPRVERLAAARAEVRRLDEPGRQDHAWQLLQSSIASYNSLPPLRGERPLRSNLSRAMEALGPARSAGGVELTRTADGVDAALLALVEFGADRTHELAISMAHERQSNVRLSAILDAIALLFTVVTGWLLARAVQQHERVIAKQNELLSRRTAELDVFSARVVHDILSPLGGLSLSLDILSRSPLSERNAVVVERSKSAVRRIERVADGLLMFARAGGRPAPGASCSLSEVLVDVLIGFQPRAEELGIALSVRKFEDVRVACGEGALTSVVSNLVGNGIKHMHSTGERRIAVVVTAHEERVHVEVTDTAGGLASSMDASRIFEPYVGTDGTGLGLGLATVKRLVEGHGGSVGVRSVTGVGCTFWFELPQARFVVDPVVPT